MTKIMLKLSLALAVGGAAMHPTFAQDNGSCHVDSNGECGLEFTDRAAKVDIICDPLEGNQIDWDCVFGPERLEEVTDKGGMMTHCLKASKAEPCSRFIVAKNKERSEVKVQEGPEGFTFLKGDKCIIKYSVKPIEDMRVAKKFTHIGQLKGSKGGYMIKGDPIYSLTANNNGLMVRFSNLESIEDYHPGMEKFLDWEKASGEWVHVKITTVFGESMEVEISGAVNGKAVWPKNLQPVAWHRDAEMVRMKIGLYHAKDKVHDQEVEYKIISIEGPAGIIRTSGKVTTEPAPTPSPKPTPTPATTPTPRPTRTSAPTAGEPGGYHYKGCFRDTRAERVFTSKTKHPEMTNAKCAEYCQGDEYFATQNGTECWCGDSKTDIDQHGKGECTVSCSGSPHETCGGFWSMSVYQDGGKPSNIPDGTKYLGCYGDKADDRIMTVANKSNDNMNYKKCKKFCKGKSAAEYMGVEYGSECFCGKRFTDFTKHGEAVCSMTCTGEDTAVCGGRDSMGVLKI